MTTGKRGGRRPGAGRPRLAEQERGHAVSLYLTDREKALVKRFLVELRRNPDGMATVLDIVAGVVPIGKMAPVTAQKPVEGPKQIPMDRTMPQPIKKAQRGNSGPAGGILPRKKIGKTSAPELEGGDVTPDMATVRAYPSGATTAQYALNLQPDEQKPVQAAKRVAMKESTPRSRTFRPIIQMDPGEKSPAASELPKDWPGNVTVWKGAQVVLCAADAAKGGRRWKKGQTATVEGYSRSQQRLTHRTDLRLVLDDGKKLVLSPKGWTIRRQGIVVGNIWQYPIKVLEKQK